MYDCVCTVWLWCMILSFTLLNLLQSTRHGCAVYMLQNYMCCHVKKRMNVSFIICNVECIAIHNTYEYDICHYACVYVRLFFVSVYVCLFVWVYVYMYVCLYPSDLSIHVYYYLCIHNILFSELANAHMHVYPSIYLHACQCMEHACVVMRARVCMYARLPTCLCACMLCMHVI